MKVLIFGGNGMLGHQLCRLLPERMEVWTTLRGISAQFDFLPQERILRNVSAQDIGRLSEILDIVKPHAVVNAVGIVKQRDEAKQAAPSIQINALFPHQLADLCVERDIRVIQISTDCVFSGFRGNYTEIDNPDPVDLYGRTKLLGELNRPGTLTLRTSIIGWQLNMFTSLLSWFVLQRGKHIKGYRKAIYNGFSTSVLSQLIGDILLTRPDLTGIYQVASDPISKYDLLMQLRNLLGWMDITLDPDDNFFCDRSLSGARFSHATGWRAPSWDNMLEGLAAEWSYYQKYYPIP
jgi:dTDP-4-dehydrorhamnose reductase